MKQCTRCGRKNKDDAVVCRRCGAALVDSIYFDDSISRSQQNNTGAVVIANEPPYTEGGAYTAEANGNNGSKKSKAKAAGKWLLAALIAAAVIAAGILILAAVNSRGLYLPGGSSYTVLEHEDCLNVVYKGREALPNVMKASAVLSADANTAAVINEEGMLFSTRGGVGHTVDSKVGEVTVCDNGKFLFYTTAADSKLWVYDCGKNDTQHAIANVSRVFTQSFIFQSAPVA